MAEATLTKKDFQSDQIVRWCPGCGDYAILAAIQSVMPNLGVPKEKIVFVSGIGCSSRFPYYMNTYGFHTIHGRAPAIATGLKLSNPDLQVFVVTGDGDGLSIGGNHLLHVLRRNIDVKILLFNNKVYGLTKGQYSPTSDLGFKTKSSPMGSLDQPINPIRIALASEASFVARTYDANIKHMTETFEKAAAHKGSAFIEILQNCVIFNKDVFNDIYERDVRSDHMVHLEEGEPLVFGAESDKGVFLDGFSLKTGSLEAPPAGQLLTHQPNQESPIYANLLAAMEYPQLPLPVGVFRKVPRPGYEAGVQGQIAQARTKQPDDSLQTLFHSGDTWEVK
ncbi:MAG: 2-oxoacid:ferredoxin oxidoreductase subunit beta [Acidobacteria bacterium]|nr:2-oxoacid:ferredoxin oxidoreductase subunit beta [Acidobacteriota bacterium]MCB9397599.1 2-oxoacid:ferredoxin oxidoreductase subunit beta [Acidobacteriota bacterium]